MKKMKSIFTVIVLGLTFSACASARKRDQLQALQWMDQKIEQSKTASCDQIHDYLDKVQVVVRRMILDAR